MLHISYPQNFIHWFKCNKKPKQQSNQRKVVTISVHPLAPEKLQPLKRQSKSCLPFFTRHHNHVENNQPRIIDTSATQLTFPGVHPRDSIVVVPTTTLISAKESDNSMKLQRHRYDKDFDSNATLLTASSYSDESDTDEEDEEDEEHYSNMLELVPVLPVIELVKEIEIIEPLKLVDVLEVAEVVPKVIIPDSLFRKNTEPEVGLFELEVEYIMVVVYYTFMLFIQRLCEYLIFLDSVLF